MAMEIAARTGVVLLKTGACSDFDDNCPKKKGDFQARINNTCLKMRCAGRAGYGFHITRERSCSWLVKKNLPHFDSCRGGNYKGDLARAAHKDACKSGAIVKARGGNTNHRCTSFEAQHFCRVFAEIGHNYYDKKTPGSQTTLVQALCGLITPFVRHIVTEKFCTRVLHTSLRQMYGTPEIDITLMPGIKDALEKVGYTVEIVYKDEAEAKELALAAQKVCGH